MTTIVCNKTEMACDLQITSGDVRFKAKTKIYRVDPHEMHYNKEPFIIGFAGDSSNIIEVVDFYYRPDLYKKIPRLHNVFGLVLTESGVIYQFSRPGVWRLLDQQFASVGSGAAIALGALHMGATPKEAIQAATKVDIYTGMGTKVLKF